MRQQAYSMIEVVAVITIVGLLSAVAIPSYMNYRNRANVSSAVAFGMGMLDDIVLKHVRLDSWPDEASYNGVTVPNDTSRWAGRSSVGNVFYVSGPWHSVPDLGRIYISVTGLINVTGYVEPTDSGNGGTNANLNTTFFPNGSMLVFVVDRNYVKYCGVAGDYGDQTLSIDVAVPPCLCDLRRANIDDCIAN